MYTLQCIDLSVIGDTENIGIADTLPKLLSITVSVDNEAQISGIATVDMKKVSVNALYVLCMYLAFLI